MSSVIVAGNTSGSVSLFAPDVSGSTVLTLPTTTGTMMVNGPAFSAYAASAQSITATVVTKVLFGTEEFDTNNNFASSTFTPTVAGYYQVNAQVSTGTAQTRLIFYIYKNGSVYKSGNDLSSTAFSSTMGALVYMNGSTDYLEVYTYFSTTGNTQNAINSTWFNGSMVRGA
jgi:hypothetical protein